MKQGDWDEKLGKEAVQGRFQKRAPEALLPQSVPGRKGDVGADGRIWGARQSESMRS